MEKRQENNNLIHAYERLHKDYCYLDEKHNNLETLVNFKEDRIQYLEKDCADLKERVNIKEDRIQYLERECNLMKEQLRQKERMLWVTQLERERYKNENYELRKAMQHNL